MTEQSAHKGLALADRCMILRRDRVTWNGEAVAAGHLAEHYFGDKTDADQPAGEAS